MEYLKAIVGSALAIAIGILFLSGDGTHMHPSKVYLSRGAGILFIGIAILQIGKIVLSLFDDN